MGLKQRLQAFFPIISLQIGFELRLNAVYLWNLIKTSKHLMAISPISLSLKSTNSRVSFAPIPKQIIQKSLLLRLSLVKEILVTEVSSINYLILRLTLPVLVNLMLLMITYLKHVVLLNRSKMKHKSQSDIATLLIFRVRID